MSPHRWALLAAALAAACQAGPTAPPRDVPALSRETLSRFRLGDPEAPPPLEPLHVLGSSERADADAAPVEELALGGVLNSVEVHFPLILAALEEIEIAEGRVLGARGSFDTRLGSISRFDVEGFYESQRADVFLEQPTTLWGTTFFGGYRIGTGDFPVYDGGDKTNEDGEVRLGVRLPLLQGGRIDPRRVDLWSAMIERDQAEPLVMQKRLEATQKAADAYWRWVSWGRRREVALRLLALAEDRQEQVELAVEEGLLARINLTENQRLIVDRRSKLVRADRGLQQAAILLSLYWRDADGQPVVPPDSALPYEFPSPRDPGDVLIPDQVEIALKRRPEVRNVELELARLDLDESLARNELLPQLDVDLLASQDLGDAVNAPDDKEDFELKALVRFGLPLQRREARGKLSETAAKIAQLEREFQFVKELVTIEVRDAASALRQSWLRLAEARQNVSLAAELAEAERVQLGAGESDLFRVNLREQQAALAAAALVDVLDEHFRSLAQYRAALGIPYDEVVAGEPVGGELRP